MVAILLLLGAGSLLSASIFLWGLITMRAWDGLIGLAVHGAISAICFYAALSR
jgi:hypothetical protein